MKRWIRVHWQLVTYVCLFAWIALVLIGAVVSRLLAFFSLFLLFPAVILPLKYSWCPECGRSIRYYKDFCPHCGARLDDDWEE